MLYATAPRIGRLLRERFYRYSLIERWTLSSLLGIIVINCHSEYSYQYYDHNYDYDL